MHRSRHWLGALALAAAAGAAAPVHASVPFDAYLWRAWSTGSGLPQVSAIDLAQDADGFVWVATIGGLARFNGERFRVYDRTNTPEMESMMLQRLHVDRHGTLWIATAANMLRRTGGGFSEVPMEVGPLEGARAFAELDDGKLYVGGERLYRLHGQRFIVVEEHRGPVHALHARGDTLWIGGTDGIGELGPAGYRWHPLPQRDTVERIAHLDSHAGALWAGTDRGLFRFRGGRWSPATLDGAGTEPVHMVHADVRGNLWVGTQSRLLRLRGGVLQETVDGGSGWGFGTVISAMDDRDGNLWFGTRTEGIVRLRVPATRNHGRGAGIPDPLTWVVVPWDDGVLVGTDRGVALLRDGRFTPVVTPAQLPNPVAYALHGDRRGRLWVGTRAGLSVFAADGFRPLRTFDEVSHVQVNSVYDDADGTVWVGAMDGLYRLDRDSGALRGHPDLDGARVRVLHELRGVLWAGTENGLFHRVDDRFERVDEPDLGASFITYLGELGDGTLVAGTFDHGFALHEPGGWRWVRPEDGLPAMSALFVGEVGDNVVVTSLQGVYTVPLAAVRGDAALSATMAVDDRGGEPPGDAHRCCNGGGNGRGLVHRGRVWVPTLDGVVAIPIQRIGDHDPPPRPVIEAAAGPRGARDRRFEFSAPVYERTTALQFRYRLDGYDDGWIDAAHAREATYTNLPAGRYTFEVAAAVDAAGGWSAPASTGVVIEPYWYETTIARVGFVALALALLSALSGAVMMAARRRQRLLEHLVSQRTRELDDAVAKLEKASLADPLTGLHNRRYFDRMLPQIRARGDRSTHPPACLLLDLDHFKHVNDHYGHAVGDGVLQELASLLRTLLRGTDHLIRWGGEEFLIIQENSSAPEDVAVRLTEHVARHDWTAAGLDTQLTCSIGGAIHPRPGTVPGWGWESTLLLADKALYLVKSKGRNGWILLTPAPGTEALAARLPDADVAALLDSGQVTAAHGRPAPTGLRQ